MIGIHELFGPGAISGLADDRIDGGLGPGSYFVFVMAHFSVAESLAAARRTASTSLRGGLPLAISDICGNLNKASPTAVDYRRFRSRRTQRLVGDKECDMRYARSVP
jgi:hypothetical protein